MNEWIGGYVAGILTGLFCGWSITMAIIEHYIKKDGK